MKNALIGLVFAVALSGVLSDDFPSNSFNTKNSEIQSFSYLPNEFPQLSALFSIDGFSSIKKKAADDLKKIIGYLPLPEQNLLYNAMLSDKSGANVFDWTYFSSHAQDIIDKERDALLEYINENAKRLPKGLGCILKVVNTFSHDSFEDKELLNSIYTNIDNVLQAQEKVAECDRNFLKILIDDGLARRQLLIEQIKYNNGVIGDPNKILLKDKKEEYYNIQYHYDTTTTTNNPTADNTIAAFKEFASCHQYYYNEITRNVIEAEQSIAQLKKCFNEDEYNPDAGKSSNKVVSSINYHKKKIIGINDGNGTRSDQRTQNNHTLNSGFRLGKQSLNFTGNNKQTALQKDGLNLEWTTNINKIEPTLLNKIASKTPFANLHNLLITFADTISSQISAKCIQAFEKGEDITNAGCTTDPAGTVTISFSNFKNNGISITVGNIILYNNQILYSEATIDGKDYYDIYFDGKSIGHELAETSTACISSFGSGGKNDKEACRDVMKTKCGNELDFRCKQSNLYDILNEMPISRYQMPPACLGYVSSISLQTPNEACLNWINEKFMLGGIIPKPSQFITYGLTAQSDANYYYDAQTEYENKYNSYTLLSQQALTSSPKLSVTGTKVNDVKSIDFKNAMDATYAIMVDSSYSYSTSSFLICLLFIILF